jgi:uncharacterized protein (TIGR00251 family)
MTARERNDDVPYRLVQGELLLRVRAITNAGRNEIVGVRAGELVVKLRVPPLEGRANRELVRLLASRFGLSRSSVDLVAGLSSHHKRLRLPAEAIGALNALCENGD